MVLGLILGVVLINFDENLPRFTPILAVQVFVGFYLSVLFHEGGHVLGALAVKFKLLIFAIWRLGLRRTRDGWRISRLGKTRLSGFVAAYPQGTQNLARRFFWLVAGGPAASAITGVIAVLAARSMEGWVAVQLNILGFWSLFTVVLTAIPFSGRYAVNDGTRMLMMLRGGAQAERICSLLLLSGGSLGGLRPREWDAALVRVATTVGGAAADVAGGQTIRYNWLIDSGETHEAGTALTWLLQQEMPEANREVWFLEAAWYSARFAGDLAAARRWLAAAPVRGRMPETRCALLKAQAAIALLEGRRAEAEDAARRGLVECERIGSDAGVVIAIRDALQRVIEDARSSAVRD
jgi:hypothetical protein